MDEDQLDLLFHALASQPRRAILDLVRNNGGCNVNFVTSHFAFSRIGVMKHLDVLQAANLVISQKNGRDRELFFNPVPLQEVHEHWTDHYSRHFAARLTQLKRIVETGTKGGK